MRHTTSLLYIMAIHNFCTIDLSSFYLDFAKDILYIEGANHEDRRAIQTVLYDVLVALTKTCNTNLTAYS